MTRATATECQCKRCGSSMTFEPCEHCVDGVTGHDCGDDTCCCADPEDNVACDSCEGTGGRYVCLSSAEWCEANPQQGQEATPRHTPEWFCWHGIGAETDCKRCEEGDVA